MKRLIICMLMSCLCFTGCQSTDISEVQSQIEKTAQEKKDELVESAQAEVKKALVSQIESFFSDQDLAAGLGITEEKKEELLQKLEETIEDYDMEASGIEGFQEQINEVLEQELQGHSTESNSDKEQSSDSDAVTELKEQLQNAFTQFLGKKRE